MGNFETKFISNKQDYETPDEIFKPLNDEFNFTLDVCATYENTKCRDFIPPEVDGLKTSWSKLNNEVCWMNPPFNNIGKWIEKAFNESLRGATVICLVTSKTNTNWWHNFAMKADEIRYIKGRPKFKGCKHGLPLPLSIVIFKGKKSA